MLEATKKLTTNDYVELNFRVPAQQADKAKKVLASLGAEDLKDSVPWEEVYPDFNPSVALRGARKREGLTQKDLADRISIKQAHISQMENGRRPIGKEMAKRLAKALNVDYRVFL